MKTAEGQAFLEVMVSDKRREEHKTQQCDCKVRLEPCTGWCVRTLVQNGLRVWLWSHPEASYLESVHQQISMAF